MKDQYYFVRLVGVLTVGLLLLKFTYNFKHFSFIFDLLIFRFVAAIGLSFLVWSLFTDLRKNKLSENTSRIIPAILGFIFIVIIWTWNSKINQDFTKPTLLSIYYDGDYNGVGIDFKKDGTYIFDNSAIGMSDYLYGTYAIDGKKITLDKKEIDNIIKSRHLEIRPNTIGYVDSTNIEYAVFQIDNEGHLMKNELKFRVIENEIIE